MRSVQRGIATIFLVIIILASVSAVTAVYLGYYAQQKQKAASINSFEDCAKLYPVMESYPEQCNTPDGKHFTKELTKVEKQKVIPPQEPSPSVKINNIANWETYTDPLKTYTFKYPREWNVISERSNLQPSNLVIASPDFISAEPTMGGGNILGAKQGLQFELAQGTNSSFRNYDELKNFYESNSPGYPINFFKSKKEIQINGINTMLWLDGNAEFGGNKAHAYFIYKDILYDISFTSATNQDGLFEQILSTLKFL